MAWVRVRPDRVLPYLRADCGPDGGKLAERALAHVREALLSGAYVAVLHDSGRMFIGTEAEAAEHMMEQPSA